jgi:hypothetical protein
VPLEDMQSPESKQFTSEIVANVKLLFWKEFISSNFLVATIGRQEMEIIEVRWCNTLCLLNNRIDWSHRAKSRQFAQHFGDQKFYNINILFF